MVDKQELKIWEEQTGLKITHECSDCGKLFAQLGSDRSVWPECPACGSRRTIPLD